MTQISYKQDSKEIHDPLFNKLYNELLDKEEVVLDLQNISFISVHFLEQLEKLINKANELNRRLKIINVSPNIYKVFRIARNREILAATELHQTSN